MYLCYICMSFQSNSMVDKDVYVKMYLKDIFLYIKIVLRLLIVLKIKLSSVMLNLITM